MSQFAIIFDFNGVIIKDERLHQESWRYICQKYRFTLSEEEFIHKVFGRTEAETFEFLFKKPLSLEALEKLSAERVQYVKSLIKNIGLTQGFKSFLEQLKSYNIPIGIATSSRRPYLNYVLTVYHLSYLFDVIVSAEDIQKGKPDPEIYIKTAQLLHVKPEKCIVFEDSLSGISSAKSAGMHVIAISTTHNANELRGADQMIEDFSEMSMEKIAKVIEY
jgi:beta-phosphoglucomutase